MSNNIIDLGPQQESERKCVHSCWHAQQALVQKRCKCVPATKREVAAVVAYFNLTASTTEHLHPREQTQRPQYTGGCARPQFWTRHALPAAVKPAAPNDATTANE